MIKENLWIICLTLGMASIYMFFPDMALAQYGGFETKVNNLTSSIVNILLPACSILGLIYAAILASTGDPSARQRMTLIVVASIVGFLAPLIIKWLQGASGL